MRLPLFFLVYVLCYLPLYAATHFLTLSDMHYGATNTSGMGHDTGDLLWATALTKFHQLSTQADFIIMLGDIPTHHLRDADEKSNYEKKIFHDLYQANSRHKPMFYVTGNNDSLVGNYKQFSKKGISPLNNALDWHGACANCQGLVIDDSHMHSDGYYASYVMQGNSNILLIVLNANQFINPGFFYPKYPNQDNDAITQLEWLGRQLNQHHAKQLLIAMHEEPGLDYQNHPVWHPRYLAWLIKLLTHYQTNYQQISLLAAHSHYDEIRKLSLTNHSPIYSYSTPSISRNHYNNSAMKVFSLNDNYFISDVTTYYTTDDTHWGDDHYSVMQTIFPHCNAGYVAQCLDSLSNAQVCQQWEGLFIFTVKNQAMKVSNCLRSYLIN